MKDKIIKKQDELIKHLSRFATFNVSGAEKRDKIISELTALKSESEKPFVGFDLEKLKKHLEETPLEKLREEWKAITDLCPSVIQPQSEPRETAEEVLNRCTKVNGGSSLSWDNCIKAMEEHKSSPDLRRELIAFASWCYVNSAPIGKIGAAEINEYLQSRETKK